MAAGSKRGAKATPRERRRTGERAASARAGRGPVTLEQARALALASLGARTAPARPAATALAPARIGQERRRQRVEWHRERRRRIAEYKATLAVLERRGVKGLRAPTGPAGARERAAGRPLRVLAEGDSWFDYPVPFFGGGIVPRLEKLLGVPVLNLAKAGDEVRYMLGVEQRQLIAEQLGRGCPTGGSWDALLFSGGGNDIVADPMALWIRDYDPARGGPEAQLHQPRLGAALALVRAGYEDLVALRDALSPGTHLFFHGYDYAIADGRGICHLGPWLKPAFDLRGFPHLEARVAVTKAMLGQFAAMLRDLAASHPNVTVIETQGTLPEERDAWHNELHPAKAGYDEFARLFRDELRKKFPTRVR